MNETGEKVLAAVLQMLGMVIMLVAGLVLLLISTPVVIWGDMRSADNLLTSVGATMRIVSDKIETLIVRIKEELYR